MNKILFIPRGLLTLLVFYATIQNTIGQSFNYTLHEGIDNLFNIIPFDSSNYAMMTTGYPYWPRSLSILKIEPQGIITKKKDLQYT
ncbi:MAG: hypothetical protein IPO27_16310 [Bacteroidetes bacterium]|nr:hypothetical protein [Bacteroidota bacterium]